MKKRYKFKRVLKNRIIGYNIDLNDIDNIDLNGYNDPKYDRNIPYQYPYLLVWRSTQVELVPKS